MGTLFLATPTPAFTTVPGLSQTIVVPANAVVYISTDGGILTDSINANAGSTVDVVITLDGFFLANSGFRRLSTSHELSGGGFTQWSAAQVLSVSPGSHTITVQARLAEGAAARVSGDFTSVLQGQLTTLIINR